MAMKQILTYLFILLILVPLGIISSCSTKKCIEHPIDDCMCTLQYDPVCGCNNKTYGNACAAECAGIKVYTKGPCEKSE